METEGAVIKQTVKLEAMINAQDLCYRYPGQKADTIRGISFTVTAGEIFGFLGPSGSGKSTTQKLLIGLLRNYQGCLQIMDRDAHAWNHEIYQHIGVGFELPNHFLKLTGLENLKLFASFYGAGSKSEQTNPNSLLDMVGLTDAKDQRVGEYSKGMKMRLNFARALLNDPLLLFLDEPTAGLDPVNAKIIKDIVRDLQRQGKTVFLTTHNMHDADELCDRVAFVVEGELNLIDEPSVLKLRHGQKSVEVIARPGEDYTQPDVHQFELDNLGNNQAFVDLLNSGSVESIHSQEATLEEVFIETTGAQLT